MDLFEEKSPFENLQTAIESLCDRVTQTHKLPFHGIWYEPIFSKAKNQVGLLISFSIFINEPVYPATEDEMKDENRKHIPIVTVKRLTSEKDGNRVGLAVQNVFFTPQVTIPLDAEMDPVIVKIKIDSPLLISFVEELVEWKLKNYVTAASPFGCCDLHVKCSDAKMCLHANRLYSTACAYRRNLEAGRIFYGANRNV